MSFEAGREGSPPPGCRLAGIRFFHRPDPRRPAVESPPEELPCARKVVHVTRARTDEQVDRRGGEIGPWLSFGISDDVALTHGYEDGNHDRCSLGSHCPGRQTRRPDGSRDGRRCPRGWLTEACRKTFKVGPNQFGGNVVVEETPSHVQPPTAGEALWPGRTHLGSVDHDDWFAEKGIPRQPGCNDRHVAWANLRVRMHCAVTQNGDPVVTVVATLLDDGHAATHGLADS